MQITGIGSCTKKKYYLYTMNKLFSHNMFTKMYGHFCRHLYECWIF